ncbi:MAG: DUF6273 domain-containing protein, partial [Deltaproteobacteria bacterium]
MKAKKKLSAFLVYLTIIAMVLQIMPMVTYAVAVPTVGSTVVFAGAEWLCINADSGYKLLRKDIVSSQSYGLGNNYSTSNIRSYINGTYYNSFTAEQKNKIVQSTWYYGNENGETGSQVTDYIGLLRYSEYNSIKDQGWYASITNNSWWLITPNSGFMNTVASWIVQYDNSTTYWGHGSSMGVRPVLYLDSDVTFTEVSNKFYADGENLPVTVTYDAEGGTVSPETQVKLQNSTYSKGSDGTTDDEMPIPTKEGYCFAG